MSLIFLVLGFLHISWIYKKNVALIILWAKGSLRTYMFLWEISLIGFDRCSPCGLGERESPQFFFLLFFPHQGGLEDNNFASNSC